MMWYTFRKGEYDFGATEKNIVKLSHNSSYLDIFYMVNDGVVSLLNDFYQLTGNPVLLPKFGFTKDISMPTTVTTGRKTRKESSLKTESVIKKARKTMAASKSL